jgi:hypothetical protein
MLTAVEAGAFQVSVTEVAPAASVVGLTVKVTCASTGAVKASAKRNTQLVIFFT